MHWNNIFYSDEKTWAEQLSQMPNLEAVVEPCFSNRSQEPRQLWSGSPLRLLKRYCEEML